MMDMKALAAEFPRSAVHWRAQTLTQTGDKALALAYLGARDVMDRLDDVCGPENWQSEIAETAKGRVICRLGIRIDGDWVWKSDGAGDTAVEGEKGGISDSLKRAAVQWGIGRYLYRLDAVWAPCETYERGGKKHWKAWKGSPWDFVRAAPKPAADHKPKPELDQEGRRNWIKAQIGKARHLEELERFWGKKEIAEAIMTLHPAMQGELQKAKDERAAALFQAPPEGPDIGDGHEGDGGP